MKKRAIALKDLGFAHHADLLLEAARHAERKAEILRRIEQLRVLAKPGKDGLNK